MYQNWPRGFQEWLWEKNHNIRNFSLTEKFQCLLDSGESKLVIAAKIFPVFRILESGCPDNPDFHLEQHTCSQGTHIGLKVRIKVANDDSKYPTKFGCPVMQNGGENQDFLFGTCRMNPKLGVFMAHSAIFPYWQTSIKQ